MAERSAAAVKLRDWMADQGATAADLAEMLGVTESAVFHWVAGRRVPELASLVAIERITERQVPVAAWVAPGAGGVDVRS